ncbi:DUF1269 domain-containing protein [Halomonas daqiaonensis]|uniref:DUF1269 domain-containing protein n=1 Tax=Halomonas daqiaonensis TaxID=650850 RepID=A0A1H7FLF1_9GAMM|nr:DUF1269 domain-containing protein [Halomonas daqiaonensis]SEK26788.1 hypothetical protein SAMN04488129_101155 [Halomonas daqiaonensis]
MSRLYFLTPDLDTTVNIARELDELGLSKDQVHVTGENWRQLEKRGVHNATLRETSDVVNAAKRGLIYGLPLGLVLGVVTYYALENMIGDMSFLMIAIGMTVFGGLFGIWSSTMIGVSVPDVKIEKYKDDLGEGAFLMMVDVPNNRESEINSVIHRHHPEVVIDKVTQEEKKHHAGVGR